MEFLPKPLPDVKPKSEGEPVQEDPSQAKPVTSKASDPSEAEPTTAKQDGATGKQKRSKLTASSVKKAVAATQKWGTDYRANYKKANGSIPAGHQIHHLAPRAVFRDSDLAQEWSRRGITGLNDPENLEALPQTKDAYEKSKIRIQHSGSHENWNDNARQVLGDEQTSLIEEYGSLDKVPDNVMKQAKDRVLQQLREDLLDKDLGVKRGWIKHMDNGMDKLSEAQSSVQIG
jgi:A nuclease family of the HNH/ENDO VII superfamily with conserved AHH